MSKAFTSRPTMSNRARGSTRGARTQTIPRTRQTTGDRQQSLGSTSSPRGGITGNSSLGRNRGSFGSRQPGGRAPGMQRQPLGGAPSLGGDDREGAVGGNPDAGQRISHQGAFSVIAPNERRRQQISEQARRETEIYEKHKESNKPGYVKYCGTAGGGELTQDQARRQQIQDHAQSKINRQEKQRQQKEEKKQQVESLYTQKKLDARRKSEANERREQTDAEKKRADMRKVNNAFLDRLEKSKPKVPVSQSASATPPSTSKTNSSTPKTSESGNQRRDVEARQPMGAAAVSYQSEEARQPMGAATVSYQSEEAKQPMGAAVSYQSEDMNEDLQTLQTMFPQYSIDAIADIYSQSHSLEVTAELLSESG